MKTFFSSGGDASIFPKTTITQPIRAHQNKKRKLSEGSNLYETNQHSDAKISTYQRPNVNEETDRNGEAFEIIKEDEIRNKSNSNDNELDINTESGILTNCDSSHGDSTTIRATDSINTPNENHSFVKTNGDKLTANISSSPVRQEHMDCFRTGAKCVPNGVQDPLKSGSEYHITGALRIKPGRGFRTNSMSCSDKLLKWRTLGLQGGLLSTLLERPVRLSALVLAAPNFNGKAVERALSFRNRAIDGLDDEGCDKIAVLHVKSSLFEDGKRCVSERSIKGDNIFSSGVGR